MLQRSRAWRDPRDTNVDEVADFLVGSVLCRAALGRAPTSAAAVANYVDEVLAFIASLKPKGG